MRELLVSTGALNNKTLPLSKPNTIQLAHGEIDQIEATPVSIAVAKSSSQGNDTKDETVSLLENKRAAILVAATMIASMAFQVGLNSPGGVWDDNKSKYNTTEGNLVDVIAGTSIMAINYHKEYILFGAFNTASFVGAISTILLVLHGLPRFGATWFCVLKQKVFLWFLTGVIWTTMTTLAITYFFGMIFISPGHVGFEGQWDGIAKIVGFSTLVWLGLIFIILLVNICRLIICICRLFICFIMKVTKCITRSCTLVNEGERLGNSIANATTCCMSV
ncbi:hypothetical protein LguiA_004927 [Lonicera macranthoides]